jgi:polysaccharide pyruvyl transferase WcaK-like protein
VELRVDPPGDLEIVAVSHGEQQRERDSRRRVVANAAAEASRDTNLDGLRRAAVHAHPDPPSHPISLVGPQLYPVDEHAAGFCQPARPGYSLRVPGRNAHRRIVFVGGWAAHRHVGDDAVLRVHLDELDSRGIPIEPLILGPDSAELEARFGEPSAPGLERFLSDPLDHGPDLSAAQRLALIGGLRTGTGGALAHPDVRRLNAELENAEALIVLGAGSLTSKYMSTLWTQAATAAMARALGIPVLVAGAMLGPVSNALDAMALRGLLQCAELVCARDRVHSPALARELGVEAVMTEGDPAARLDAAWPVEESYAVVCVGSESWRDYASAIDALYDLLGLPTIGVPMDFSPERSDLDTLELLRQELLDPAALRIPDPPPSDPQVVGLIARARVAFGSRYHLGVFAAAHGTPCVLVHFDLYSRWRAEGLADLTGSRVSVSDTSAGPDGIRRLVLKAVAAARHVPLPPPSLPAVDWLAGQPQTEVAPTLTGR